MSSTSPQPTEEPAPAKPGKIRTWWHPLLANLLRWQLGSHYHLEEEVPVGQKPLQIDMLLLQKEQGELPESARQILAGLAEHLGNLTLLEFKSPSDTLRAGDFPVFAARLDALGRGLEAAASRISAASCYQKGGELSRAANLYQAALAAPLRANTRRDVEAMLAVCLEELSRTAVNGSVQAGDTFPVRSGL